MKKVSKTRRSLPFDEIGLFGDLYTVFVRAGYDPGTEVVSLYNCNTVDVCSDGKAGVEISSGTSPALVSVCGMVNVELC